MTVSSSGKNNARNLNRAKRAFAVCTPKWQRFQQTLIIPSEKAADSRSETSTYMRQYSHVYDHRLVALKSRCWSAMKNAADGGENEASVVEVKSVLELREDVPSMLVGTLVKESTNDGDSGSKESPLLHPDSKCRDSDQLYLEDESGRVALQVENPHQFCMGVVVGAKGTVDENGILAVDTVYPPEPLPHNSKLQNEVLEPSMPGQSPPHLLLVSGLRCGDGNVSSLPRDMLVSYLQGHFTPDAQKVCRVIVCGGGPSSSGRDKHEPSPPSLFGVRELDGWGLQLCASGIPVDILPGKSDPTTPNWPQRPFHSSLFPKSNSTRLWKCTPNPYSAWHGTRQVVGTDGENVRDLCQSVLHKVQDQGTEAIAAEKDSSAKEEEEDMDTTTAYVPITELEALKKTLEWGHICPTGPDSVPTVPHADLDPMVLDSTPHLYFCGNATKFATDIVVDKTRGVKTRLVAVPSFADTGEAVLVNLETLGVELLRFEESYANSG